LGNGTNIQYDYSLINVGYAPTLSFPNRSFNVGGSYQFNLYFNQGSPNYAQISLFQSTITFNVRDNGFNSDTIYVNEAFTFTYTMTSDEIANTITPYPYGFYYIAISSLSPPHTQINLGNGTNDPYYYYLINVSYAPTLSFPNRSFNVDGAYQFNLYFNQGSPNYDQISLFQSTITFNLRNACFIGDTTVLMKNNEFKKIQDIIIGDCILENVNTNKTNIVCNIYKKKICSKIFKIPKGAIGNTDDLIGIDHPIFCNDFNNRIFLSKIKECVDIIIDDYIYNIQFEDEGTYYANGIMVDSLSPNHQFFKLPKDMFIDKTKYIENLKVYDEDDKFRNKPTMTEEYYNIVHL
jgi:hypothetical protein